MPMYTILAHLAVTLLLTQLLTATPTSRELVADNGQLGPAQNIPKLKLFQNGGALNRKRRSYRHHNNYRHYYCRKCKCCGLKEVISRY